MVPVGVGGVMMMLGTSRCLSFRTGASSWLLLALTHILKPEKAADTQQRQVSASLGSRLPHKPSPSLPWRVSLPTLSKEAWLAPTVQMGKLRLRKALKLANSMRTVSSICPVH
jgi:hypothetical protein